jgi:hypothetical protein
MADARASRDTHHSFAYPLTYISSHSDCIGLATILRVRYSVNVGLLDPDRDKQKAYADMNIRSPAVRRSQKPI